MSQKLPAYDPQCPFCPGNEAMLPGILDELKPEHGGQWLTRVVPNKYPALTPDAGDGFDGSELNAVRPGFGLHEVIVETPQHNRDLPMLPEIQLEHILETYLRRYRFIRDRYERIQAVVIFRNHGRASGTSLVHPHSQLIAAPVIPQSVRDRQANVRRYFETHQRCLLCDIITMEKQQKQRCVYENASWLCWVPFAAEVPYEVWLAPKSHQADFAAIRESEKADLAAALKNLASAFCDRLGDPAYNLVVNACLRPGDMSAHLHWYLQLCPRLTTPAGFEIGSGMRINPSLPEADAETLRI